MSLRLIVKEVRDNVKQSFNLPGDKSIAHRSLIIGSLAKGRYKIENFPRGLDCLATLDCVRKLGVSAEMKENIIFVDSPGYESFNKYPGILDAKNSGTTVRLMSGVLAGCGIKTSFIGDESLSKRPMKRIIKPLEKMGAKIKSSEGLLPLKFEENSKLKAINYQMPVASAQVKSCLLIAGFLGEGETIIKEQSPTRDHSERMFKYINASINKEDNIIKIKNSELKCKDIYVPGDVSTAAFLIGTAIISNNCELVLENVLLNPGRKNYIDILKDMGASIEVYIKEKVNEEEIGTVKVKSSNIHGITISSERIPNIIDEIPILSVISAFAKGTTVFEEVDELKYKESNRIEAIIDNLKAFGVKSQYINSSLIIYGDNDYIDAEVTVNPKKDHRIALSFLAMAAKNKGKTHIENFECTEISFPKAIDYFKCFYDLYTE